MSETSFSGGRDIDASHAQGVQVGEHNRQVNYVTQIVNGRTERAPRITVHGEIQSPYMGLNAFGEDDAAFFFGRDQAIEDVLRRLSERLHTKVPLLVSGASGAGKSSLLRAGVLPRLASAGLPGLPGARLWRRVTFTPARAPIAELAAAIAPLTSTDAATLRRSLTADPRGLADILASVSQRNQAGGTSRLVLYIDQFEQVFTQGADPAERAAFITALHAAATEGRGPAHEPGALVLLSGRADFEARFAEHEELAEAVQSRYLLTPMTERQLRLAVTGPAEAASASVDPRLADELVRASRGSGSAVLPHLSHALDQAWRHRADDDTLRLEDYDRAGGLEGSIRASADLAYASLTEAQKTAARPVFMHLVKVSSDLAVSAGRATRSELAWGQPSAEDVNAVVELFAAERLLTVDEVFVEISHEVLLVAWGTLRGWLDGDRIDLAQYSRLTADAYDWESRGRPASYLYPPGRLAEVDESARRWQAVPGRYPALGQTAQEYLDAARRAARRARGRRRAAVSGLSVLTAAAVIAATIASYQTVQAHRQTAVAMSQAMAGQSLTLAQANPLEADRKAAQAWDEARTPQASAAMTQLLAQQEHNGALPAAPPNTTMRIALSPDGSTLAAVDTATNYLRLWNTATGRPDGPDLPLGNGAKTSGTDVAFSPDGRTLAVLSLGGDGQVHLRLWNPAAGTVVRTLAAPPTLAWIAFGGNTLIGADGNGTVYRWNPATGQPVGQPLRTGVAVPVGLAVSPDGQRVALINVTTEGVWNLAAGRSPGRTWPANVGTQQEALAFSPDGKTLASGGNDAVIRFRNAVTGQPAGRVITDGTADTVFPVSLAYSPGGSLVSADNSGQVKVWNPVTGVQAGPAMTEASPSGGHGNGIDAGIAISPRTGLLATADFNGTVQLWNEPGRQPAGAPLRTSDVPVAFSPQGNVMGPNADGYLAPAPHVLSPGVWTAAAAGVRSANGAVAAQLTHQQVWLVTETGGRVVPAPASTDTVALSADGGLLATATRETGTTVRLWNTATGTAGPALAVGDDPTGLAFSPDGKLLAVGRMDGTIQLWDPARGTLARTLPAVNAPLLKRIVQSLAFSPDGATLADTTTGGSTVLWDPATGRPLATLDPPQTTGTGQQQATNTDQAAAVAFSPDGKLLATSYEDGTIQLWNPAARAPVGGAIAADGGSGDSSPVTGLAFTADGSALLSATDDGEVAPWLLWRYSDPYAALRQLAG